MVIQPLVGNPYNGYINPYYWVDDHPLLYGNNGSLDPSTHGDLIAKLQDPAAKPQDPAAGPTIVTLSLLQPVQLTLQAAENGKPRHKDTRDPEDNAKMGFEWVKRFGLGVWDCKFLQP